MRLHDKSVVITGAGSGLGRESALLFAREGARVVVTDVQGVRAKQVADAIVDQGGQAVARTADVRVPADMDAAVAVAVTEFGRLDVMFANAGVPPAGFGAITFEDTTVEQFEAVNDVVYKGVFLAAQSAVRQFKTQGGGGTIVVTGSAGGTIGYPGFFSYCAGKAAAHHLVRSLAVDLGGHGIRINALAPTHGMSVNFILPPDAEVTGLSYEQAAAAEAGCWDSAPVPIPLKLNRPPALSDSANVALFLASDETAYMSGVVIPATDGATLSKVAIPFEEGWQDEVAPTSVDKAGR